MEPLHVIVTEEIALEGLDGITLDGELRQHKSKFPVLFTFFVAFS
jgi:hypothetical protein